MPGSPLPTAERASAPSPTPARRRTGTSRRSPWRCRRPSRSPSATPGFVLHERLHLLVHDWRQCPSGVTPKPRRARRDDWPAISTTDAASFSEFWRLGQRGPAPGDGRDTGATPARRRRRRDRPRSSATHSRVAPAPTGYLQRLAVAPGASRRGPRSRDGDRLRCTGCDGTIARRASSSTRRSPTSGRINLYLSLGLRPRSRRPGGAAPAAEWPSSTAGVLAVRSRGRCTLVVGAVVVVVARGRRHRRPAQGLRQSDASGTVRLHARVRRTCGSRRTDGSRPRSISTSRRRPGSEIAVVIYQRLRSRSLFQASLDGELGSSLATISRPDRRPPSRCRAATSSSRAAERDQRSRTHAAPSRRRVPGANRAAQRGRRRDRRLHDRTSSRTTDVAGSHPLVGLDGRRRSRPRPRSRPTASSQMLDEDRNALATLIAALADHPDGPADVVPSPETLSALETSTIDRRPSSCSSRCARRSGTARSSPVLTWRRSGGDAPGRPRRRADHTAANRQRHPRARRSRRRGPTGAPGSPMRRSTAERPAGPSRRRRRSGRVARRPADTDRPAVHADSTRRCSTTDDVTVQSTTLHRRRARRTHFDEPGDPVLAATHLLADLSQLYFDSPSVATRHRDRTARRLGAVSRVPRHVPHRSRGLAHARARSRSTTTSAPCRARSTTTDTRSSRSLAEPSTASLGSYGAALMRTRQRLTGFSTMIDEGDPLLDSAERRLLVASAERPDHRSPIGVSRRSRRRDQPADIVPPRAGTAVGDADVARCATVPLTIRSTSPTPLRVRVLVTSPKLDFPDGRRPGRDPRRREHDGHVQGEGARIAARSRSTCR